MCIVNEIVKRHPDTKDMYSNTRDMFRPSTLQPSAPPPRELKTEPMGLKTGARSAISSGLNIPM